MNAGILLPSIFLAYPMPKIRVLVLDDSIDNQRIYKDSLNEQDYEVTLCNSPLDAFESLRHQIPYHCVLLRWELKGEEKGTSLLIKLINDFPKVPVIIVSATLGVLEAQKQVEIGASDFVKRITAEELSGAIQRVTAPPQPPVGFEEVLKYKPLVGKSKAFMSTLEKIAQAKRSRRNVLILGEPGTGKTDIARAIHDLGSDSSKPFIRFNGAGVPSTLFEAALMGTVRGAFVDAKDKVGVLEECADGTLFLDELGEITPDLQPKLLTVFDQELDKRVFRRIGGTKDILFRARLICATFRPIEQLIDRKEFLKPLYDRLAQIVIEVPPLRERENDAALIVCHHLSKKYDKKLSTAAADFLVAIAGELTGNVRELLNHVFDVCEKCPGNEIGFADLVRKFPTNPAIITQSKIAFPSQILEIANHEVAEATVRDLFKTEYFHFHCENGKNSIAEVARRTGADRKTVAKYLGKPLSRDSDSPIQSS